MLDPDDSAVLPPTLLARGALEAEYEALVNEIVARLDPIPSDPWPTHACHSGASLATRLRTYRAVGGMPDMPCGEDRAFVEAVIACGGVVRHDPDIVVVTSGRLLGRAKGGVADTIRLRCDSPESPCDDRLERVGRIVARTLFARQLRRRHGVGAVAGQQCDIDAADSICGVTTTYAGLQPSSRHLAYQPLNPSALPSEIRRARQFLRLLRNGRRESSPRADRFGTLANRTAEDAYG